MLWALTETTRMFYHDFVVVDLNTFLRNYAKLLVLLLLNPVRYTRHGMYFLGNVASDNRNKVVGFAYLRVKSLGTFRSATFGIVVHDDYHSKGLGHALTKHILQYGKKLELNVITLMVAATNDRAVKLYKKNRFEIEGLHKEADVWKNRLFDVYYMALHLNKTS